MIDDRDMRGGEKNWHHIKRGVPLRVEVGPNDIAKNGVFLARRDTGEKAGVGRANPSARIGQRLTEIQNNLFQRALKLRDDNTPHDRHARRLPGLLHAARTRTSPRFTAALRCATTPKDRTSMSF